MPTDSPIQESKNSALLPHFSLSRCFFSASASNSLLLFVPFTTGKTLISVTTIPSCLSHS
ncbi:hypothetical protein X975_18711, partial [Stegodyphus mimosarum]